MLQYKLSRLWRRYGQLIGALAGLLFGLSIFGIAGRIHTEEITWAQACPQFAACAVGLFFSWAGYKFAEYMEGD